MRNRIKRMLAACCAVLILLSLIGCSTTTTVRTQSKKKTTQSSTVEQQLAGTTDSTKRPSNTTRPTTTRRPNTSSTTKRATTHSTTKPATAQSTTKHVHSYSAATCTKPAACSCGATMGTSLGHDWKDATYYSPKTCIRCGTTIGNKLPNTCTGLTVASARSTYSFGEQDFDYEKLSVNKNYADGSIEVINGKKCTVIGFSSAKLGTNTVTITYDGYSTKLELSIVAKDINLLNMSVFNTIDDSSPSGQDLITVKHNVYDSYGLYYDKCYHINAYTAWLVSPSPSIVFRTGGHFSRFTGTIVIPEDTYNAIIKIYADDVLIYSRDKINEDMAAFEIDIDVTGCNFIKIQVTNDDLMLYDTWLKA